MKKRGIRIRKGLYIVLWMGTLFSLILCLGIAFVFFDKRKDRNQKGGKRSAGGAG